MRRRLPSLSALRAFEAAARHASFSKGAAELFVTQAAVSRSVRELEAWLDRRLFRRLHRRVELTAEGAALLAVLEPALDRIDATLQSLREPRARTLRVSVEPGFAAWWLTPRLPQFAHAHPDVDVVLESSQALAEVGETMDLAIRYAAGTPTWPGVEALRLAPIAVVPVLAPALARGTRLKHPRDLLGLRLLHEESRVHWERWFEAAGCAGVQCRGGSVFNDIALILDAAVAGQGVALADDLLTRDAVAAGDLVRPFPRALPVAAYWLVRPARRARGDAPALFERWLVATLAAEAAGGTPATARRPRPRRSPEKGRRA